MNEVWMRSLCIASAVCCLAITPLGAQSPARRVASPAAGERAADAAVAWKRISPSTAVPALASSRIVAQRASGRAGAVAGSLGILPGEFERQQAMLLACDPIVASLPELFVELVRRMHGRVEILALVQGEEGRNAAMKLLAEHRLTLPHLHFINLRHNSMWARDFGPHAVRGLDGRWSLVDAIYTCPERADDDDVPLALGKLLHMPTTVGALQIDGGNLLSNGRGLLVATTALAERNLLPGMTAESLRRRLGELYGAREVLFLEPLAGEPTAHVDMFATFTAVDTVVVGQLDPAIDLENATILDRNAARLASLRSGGKRLRVERIPMPAHADAVWRSTTNVVYVNGLLLVPSCNEFDKPTSDAALATYKRLLPHWEVAAIDAESLLALGGALHCVTMNLGHIDRLPRWEEKLPVPMDEGEALPSSVPRFETVPLGGRLQLFGTETGVRGG